MRIGIAGATGFVGSRLVESLQAEGHQILALTRQPTRARQIFPTMTFPQVEVVAYQPDQPGDWQHQIAGCDAIVNLAGASLAEGRWTAARKQEIRESRCLTTRHLVAAIAQADPKPAVLVNASAIGFYGTSDTATFDETSPAGADFLAEVCQAWEAEAQAVTATGTRLVILRLGIVLANGGALAKLLTPFRLFLGGPLGNGQQWFSWIHREDVVRLIGMALTRPDLEGVFNATAPNPVRMAELCHRLGEVLHRPSWLPVPDFALELLLGDAALLVLEGQQVLPNRTQAIGFDYQYPTIRSALMQILAQ